MRRVIVNGEFIALGQLLQFAGVVETGGEAKRLVAGSQAVVNGEPEIRRGRKLRGGDVVEVHGHEPLLVISAQSADG